MKNDFHPRGWGRALARGLLCRDGINSIPGQAARQAVNGATSTLLDLAVFHLCLRGGMPAAWSAAISFCVAFLWAFTLSRVYVFGRAAGPRRAMRGQFPRYCLLMAGTLLIIEVALWLALAAGLPPLLAKLAPIPFTYVWSVWMGRRFVFASRSSKEPRPDGTRGNHYEKKWE